MKRGVLQGNREGRGKLVHSRILPYTVMYTSCNTIIIIIIIVCLFFVVVLQLPQLPMEAPCLAPTALATIITSDNDD